MKKRPTGLGNLKAAFSTTKTFRGHPPSSFKEIGFVPKRPVKAFRNVSQAERNQKGILKTFRKVTLMDISISVARGQNQETDVQTSQYTPSMAEAVPTTLSTDEVPPAYFNKYDYDEFAGSAGYRRIHAILQMILPLALHRTWLVLDAVHAPGNDCYLGLAKTAQASSRQVRTIRRNIQLLQARKLLRLRAEKKPFRENDGTYRLKPVVVKDWAGLYRLAHEYYEWMQSKEYIDPEPEYLEIMKQDPQLMKWLRRFDNYRRLIDDKLPGRKQKHIQEDPLFADFAAEEEETFTDHDCLSEDVNSAPDGISRGIRPNNLQINAQNDVQFNTTESKESKGYIESLKRDSNSNRCAEALKGIVLPLSPTACSHIAPGTIRNAEEETTSPQIESNRTSNHPIQSKEMPGAGAAKDVKKALGVEDRPLPTYIEGRLKLVCIEFRDQAPLRSSATRLAKSYWLLHDRYEIDERGLEPLMERASKKTRSKLQYDPLDHPMAWWFTVLETDTKTLCQRWDEEQQRATEQDDQMQEDLTEASLPEQDVPGDDGFDDQEERSALDPVDENEQPQEAVWSVEPADEEATVEVEEEIVEIEVAEAVQAWPLDLLRSIPNLAVYMDVDDPADGWAKEEGARYWAYKLRDGMGNTVYNFETLPTAGGRWGFVLYDRKDQLRWWKLVTTDQVRAWLRQL